MTHTIDLEAVLYTSFGEPAPVKKCIEFTHFLEETEKRVRAFAHDQRRAGPHNWNFIELICRNYDTCVPPGSEENYDLMFAHDGDPSNGVLYLGKWNDGIVNTVVRRNC